LELFRDDYFVDDSFVEVGLKCGDNALDNGQNNGDDHPMSLKFGQGQYPFEKYPLGGGGLGFFAWHELLAKLGLNPRFLRKSCRNYGRKWIV
jgi:hypothetical protein